MIGAFCVGRKTGERSEHRLATVSRPGRLAYLYRSALGNRFFLSNTKKNLCFPFCIFDTMSSCHFDTILPRLLKQFVICFDIN